MIARIVIIFAVPLLLCGLLPGRAVAAGPNVDCVVSAWTFTPCTASCGGGLFNGTRTIATPPQGSGQPCPALVATNLPCNTIQCATTDQPRVRTVDGSLELYVSANNQVLVTIGTSSTDLIGAIASQAVAAAELLQNISNVENSVASTNLNVASLSTAITTQQAALGGALVPVRGNITAILASVGGVSGAVATLAGGTSAISAAVASLQLPSLLAPVQANISQLTGQFLQNSAAVASALATKADIATVAAKADASTVDMLQMSFAQSLGALSGLYNSTLSNHSTSLSNFSAQFTALYGTIANDELQVAQLSGRQSSMGVSLSNEVDRAVGKEASLAAGSSTAIGNMLTQFSQLQSSVATVASNQIAIFNNVATLASNQIAIFNNLSYIMAMQTNMALNLTTLAGNINTVQTSLSTSNANIASVTSNITARLSLLELYANSPLTNFGTGIDNDLVVNTGSTTVVTQSSICAYLLANVVVGASVISVSSCTGINAFAEIMIHQTQSQTLAGNYHFSIVKSVIPIQSGCTVMLFQPVVVAFNGGTNFGTGVLSPELAQVVAVRHYTSVTITSGIFSPPTFTGTCGGILAMRSTSSINIAANGAIDASGLGFRGAPQYISTADYVNGYVGESEKMGYTAVRSYLAYGSAGGAGNGNGGGYGGAHSTIGATPARGACDQQAPNPPATIGVAALTTMFFGGSGSASGSHGANGRNGATGGGSGGIIYMFAKTGVTNLGRISSNGGAGQNGYVTSGNYQPMGGGGGGAAGTIWIGSGTSNTLTVAPTVTGGAAGSGNSGGTSCAPSGVGGSGGGGRIKIDTSLP